MKLRVPVRLCWMAQNCSRHAPAADCMARPRAATSKTRHPHAQVCSRSPSHPPATRSRPTAHLGITPARRKLVAALSSRTARPRAPNSRMRAVTRRLRFAPADRVVRHGNRRATAGEREFDALTPGRCCSRPGGPADNRKLGRRINVVATAYSL